MLTRVVRLPALLAAAFLLTGGLTACGDSGPGHEPGRLNVVTSFYPLQFVASRIGGPQADVTSLTRPGAEPHDLELTPRDVARLQDADLVVYLRGFQPAVDQAVDEHVASEQALDVADAAKLTVHPEATDDDEHDHEAADGHTDEPGEHDDDHDHDHPSGLDPHFWLDPTRLADVANDVARTMAQVDPADATTFRQRAGALVSDLVALDHEYREGLRVCANTDLVTSHSAFGYLADRYGLHQVGITGLSPEAEPDPRSLARVAEFVREHHVGTIYYETLVSPAIARTVARETGATTAVLDPIEGIADTSAGTDYLEVMRSNLATLRKGQSCS